MNTGMLNYAKVVHISVTALLHNGMCVCMCVQTRKHLACNDLLGESLTGS